MKAYVLSFLAAAGVSIVLTPFVRVFALRAGVVSTPGGRHVHSRQIPRAGGVAIFAGFFASLAVLYCAEGSVASVVQQEVVRALGLFLGGLAMFALGLADDIRGVRALHKLWAQLAVGALAYAFHFRIDNVDFPLVAPMSMGIFSLPVTMLWFVGIINAVNLIDGLDGLAAGVVFFAAVTNLIVALLAGSIFVAVLMSATLGAVFGFLFYNFNPARIFMGDSGSYFLGFILAATGIAAPYQKATATVSLLVPIVALGVPIIDTLLAMTRRFLERRPIFSPDRGHIHHRLLDMGITHRRAVLIIYAVCIILTGAAIGISFGRNWEVGVAILAASVVLFGLVRFIGYFEYLNIVRRQRQAIQSRQTNALRQVIPRMPFVLSEPDDEEHLWSAFGDLVSQANLESCELLAVQPGSERTLQRWEGAVVRDANLQELVSARFPLPSLEHDDERTELKFVWRSDSGAVSPQTDILLQVVADMVDLRVAHVRGLTSERNVVAERESVVGEPATV